MPVDLNTSVPHSARIYDYLLGGKDNFEADRAAAAAIVEKSPTLPVSMRANRQYMARVAHYLAAERGIKQFLDIGTGLPTSPNLHEVVQKADPTTKIVYVDNDPIVLVHARALMISTPQGRSEYIAADIRDTASILGDKTLRDTLDFTAPIGLTLIAILMLLADEDDPWTTVAQLRDAMPSGSCLAITHPTADFAPAEVEQAVQAATGAGMTLVARDHDAVRRLFGDWEMLEPGLVPVSSWRPDAEVDHPEAAYYWAGVARKP